MRMKQKLFNKTNTHKNDNSIGNYARSALIGQKTIRRTPQEKTVSNKKRL
jgi:hypothetical protein